MKHTSKKREYTILAIIILFFNFSLKAQWEIPEKAKKMKPSVEATYKAAEEGKKLFEKNCISCHGIPGKGENNKAINATDLGSADYQSKHNIGEMFYQFNEGKGAMPSFKKRFSEEEKWHIAFYVKSFDPDFKLSGEEIKSLNGKLELQTDNDTKKIIVKATYEDENGDVKPAEGAEITFYVKRIFGNLPVSEDIKTDNNGTAVFQFPEDIPGDEKGNLKVIVKFNDTDKYGTFDVSKELAWGTVLKHEDLTQKRTLWGSNKRVPIWLLITYLSVTLGVWSVIFYVIFQITRIKKAGK